MAQILKKAWLKTRQVLAHFLATEGFLSATALAYTTLLSLVPLLVLSLSIFSIFPPFKAYVLEANQFLFEHFVPTSANEIAKHVAIFAETAAAHSVAGFLFSLVSCLLLIFSLETSFNLIGQVKTRRSLLKACSIYSLALLVFPVIIGALVAVRVYLSTVPFLVSLESILGVLSLGFTWLIFFLLYKFLPNCPVKMDHAAVGALVAAVLFSILKKTFGIYIAHFSSFTLIYGALSGVPIFLTWLYLSWIIVLLGLVISFVLAKEPAPIDKTP